MALRDVLAGEDNDMTRAADAAAHGRSLTGLSGRQTETRFGNRDDVFGDQNAAPQSPEPVMGERVKGRRIDPMFPEGNDEAARDDDPLFRRSGAAVVDRVPFGDQEQTLAYTARPGYRPYWFSDIPGRINRAKRAGYAHVIDPDTGESMNRITDRADGRGRASYLMEIPMRWYQEDKMRQAVALDHRLHDIRSGRAGPGADDNRYIPQTGIHITGR
jgi:hypothetical protein